MGQISLKNSIKLNIAYFWALENCDVKMFVNMALKEGGAFYNDVVQNFPL